MTKLSTSTIGFLLIAFQGVSPGAGSGKVVLGNFVGSWQSNSVVNKAPPDGEVLTGERHVDSNKTEWILDHEYLQTKVSTTNKDLLEITRYEKRENKYYKWIFESTGPNSFWTGHWNQKSRTMMWKIEFQPEVLEGKIVQRFLTPDKFESRFILKINQRVLYDVFTTHIRVGE